jgi:hypothetical protein
VSNVTVARIVLNPFSKPQPAWLDVPLDTRHPVAITLLATIITTTPGTVSCIVDDEAGRILVHALDCSDPAEAVQQMKERYEAPLRLIFEGGRRMIHLALDFATGAVGLALLLCVWRLLRGPRSSTVCWHWTRCTSTSSRWSC